MATKNNKKSILNSPPPPSHSKSAPPQPRKKTNYNGFTRNVNDVIRRTSTEATILPRYDQSKTVIDAHSSKIPPPVQDEHLASSIHRPNTVRKNDFSRDVSSKLKSPWTAKDNVPVKKPQIIEPEQEDEDEEKILPDHLSGFDTHGPTTSFPPSDSAEGVVFPKQDELGSSGLQTVLNAHGPIFSPLILDDKQVLGEDDDGEFDMLSLEHKAEEELYKRPKKGEAYEAVDVKRIEKRLKHLSVINHNNNNNDDDAGNNNIIQTPETMIDEGLEIADSVSLLKINGTSSSKVVEMAGQKAQRAATLIIQAQIMFNKARQLLAQSKDMLQAAEF